MLDELGARKAETVEKTQCPDVPEGKPAGELQEVPPPAEPEEPWEDISRQAPLEAAPEAEPLALTETERAVVISTAESSAQVSFEGNRVIAKCEGCVGAHTGTGVKVIVKP